MRLHQVHVYFNICMLTNVFFGCGIVRFNKKHCEGLKKTHELPLIRKMKLGDKFPRKLLHVRKSALSIGLVEPNMVMDSLALNYI